MIFLRRLFLARLIYQSRWYRRVQQVAILCTGLTILLLFIFAFTSRRIYQETDFYRTQVISAGQQPAPPPEEQALHNEVRAIAEGLRNAPNPNGYLSEMLRRLAQQSALEVQSVELSDIPTQESVEEGWQMRQYRFRMRGTTNGLQQWLEHLERAPAVLYPTGIHLDTNQAQAEGRLNMVVELVVFLPTNQGVGPGGAS